MPNYSAAVNMSTTVGQVQYVSKNSILMVRLGYADQDTSRANYHVDICNSSGTTIFADVLSSRAGYEGACTGTSVLIGKGSYFKVTHWSGLVNASLVLIPLSKAS